MTRSKTFATVGFIGATLAILLAMAGCASEVQDSNEAESAKISDSAPSHDDHSGVTKRINSNLKYDENTKIVYYYTTSIGGFSYMAPYYSENGKLMRYIDGEFVEVDDNQVAETVILDSPDADIAEE